MAQKLPSFIKDTDHFSQKIRDANMKGPFPEGTILVSWDVIGMFPNIDNNLGIAAITKALNNRAKKLPPPQEPKVAPLNLNCGRDIGTTSSTFGQKIFKNF